MTSWTYYLVALSALRLAALGSTTALNLAPAVNLGKVVAAIFMASPGHYAVSCGAPRPQRASAGLMGLTGKLLSFDIRR